VVAQIKAPVMDHRMSPGVVLRLGETELAMIFKFGRGRFQEAHPTVFAEGVEPLVGKESGAFDEVGILVKDGSRFGVERRPPFSARIVRTVDAAMCMDDAPLAGVQRRGPKFLAGDFFGGGSRREQF